MNEQHDRSIGTAIRKLAGTDKAQSLKLGTGNVESVDKDKRSCVVTLDNYVEMECLLMTQVGDGMLLIPTEGSTVLVLYGTYTSGYVIQCSDVDEIWFKGFENGGLVKVVELTDKLNAIENKVNSIISTFNSHVHTSATAGSPTTPTTSPISGTLTPTQRNDIENQNVKHGD